ncbi:MAG: hypothetical protein LBK58_03595 [Prevotellaceae bacterium]|nr:hypothetical protein [Prevotellaceae bacterium]
MIKKNENLTDAIQVPLIRLFYNFQYALQAEDYELCKRIKFEMDRRKRVYGINKMALKKILNYFGTLPPDGTSPENKKLCHAMFAEYL